QAGINRVDLKSSKPDPRLQHLISHLHSNNNRSQIRKILNSGEIPSALSSVRSGAGEGLLFDSGNDAHPPPEAANHIFGGVCRVKNSWGANRNLGEPGQLQTVEPFQNLLLPQNVAPGPGI